MPETISAIKSELQEKIGEEIKLVAQKGRKRTTEQRGVLTDLYPSIFVVELDPTENNYERVSYSYTDVLTHSVEVHFKD